MGHFRAPMVGHSWTPLDNDDRCRAHGRRLQRNLSCLTNAAIAIVRSNGRFRTMPTANRRYAARAGEAIDAILDSPGE